MPPFFLLSSYLCSRRTRLFFHSFYHRVSASHRDRSLPQISPSLFLPLKSMPGPWRVQENYSNHIILCPQLPGTLSCLQNISRILTRAQKCLYNVAQPTCTSHFQVLLLHSLLDTQDFSCTSSTSLPLSPCALCWNAAFALFSWTWPYSNSISLYYYLFWFFWGKELL